MKRNIVGLERKRARVELCLVNVKLFLRYWGIRYHVYFSTCNAADATVAFPVFVFRQTEKQIDKLYVKIDINSIRWSEGNFIAIFRSMDDRLVNRWSIFENELLGIQKFNQRI